jgi:hypothetical protein
MGELWGFGNEKKKGKTGDLENGREGLGDDFLKDERVLGGLK